MIQLDSIGDWAIVINENDTYFICHLKCGAYLKYITAYGCVCYNTNSNYMPTYVNETILKKYKLLTGES